MVRKFPHWDVHISSNLHDSEYAAGEAMQRMVTGGRASLEGNLHLAVSMRSFRAENVSGFVKALLDQDADAARKSLAQLHRYPIRITRDLAAAKEWIRNKARGSERYGLVCSSKAMRLKPHAIDVRHNVNPVHWFLNGRDDTRSSLYLEDAATEFQVQGLELDWACVNWDADLRATSGGWSHHDFRGKRWLNIHNEANRKYLLNAYRVSQGLSALSTDLNLQAAIEGHCHHMAVHSFFSHDAPEPVISRFTARAEACGARANGENIASGYRTAEDVMTGWKNSPGHDENMRGARWTRVGIGYYEREWGQVFGQ